VRSRICRDIAGRYLDLTLANGTPRMLLRHHLPPASTPNITSGGSALAKGIVAGQDLHGPHAPEGLRDNRAIRYD